MKTPSRFPKLYNMGSSEKAFLSPRTRIAEVFCTFKRHRITELIRHVRNRLYMAKNSLLPSAGLEMEPKPPTHSIKFTLRTNCHLNEDLTQEGISRDLSCNPHHLSLVGPLTATSKIHSHQLSHHLSKPATTHVCLMRRTVNGRLWLVIRPLPVSAHWSGVMSRR